MTAIKGTGGGVKTIISTPRQAEDSSLRLQSSYNPPLCGHHTLSGSCHPILKLITLIISQLRKVNGRFEGEEYFYEVGVPGNQDIRT